MGSRLRRLPARGILRLKRGVSDATLAEGARWVARAGLTPGLGWGERMTPKLASLTLSALAACSVATAAEGWWNPGWRMRTTVSRPTPYRDERPRPVEVAVDFPLLLKKAGVAGAFDPASVRVVERGREIPSACRTELDARKGRQQRYVVWTATPKPGSVGATHIYFDTKGRGIQAPAYPNVLPPPNLVIYPGFEGKAASWRSAPAELIRHGRFEHTTGKKSLKIVVNEDTRAGAGREATVSQRLDVRRWAGCEMVFECDLMAERAKYGCPVAVELQQLRADGSRIPEYAVQSRWLTLELAEGHLVQFCQRGRFSPEAATLNVHIRMRCTVRDTDTNKAVTGPEAFFTVWLDRVVVRPGERWPWPAASGAGFVEGALTTAPLNRGFEFTGHRRLAFNGASEGTLQNGQWNPNPKSVHWGLQAGTLELWCKPTWDAADGAEHILFDSVAYGHRSQCRLRKLGDGRLEFAIADSSVKTHTARGAAPLKAGRWHHIAATWDFPKAHLQLFADGKRIAQVGPGKEPWPSSLVPRSKRKLKGIGIMDDDQRSMPMQAYIGGDSRCSPERSAEAVLDELRVSDVVRYAADFKPRRAELAVDEHTRALFHLEGERHGVHDSDDRFVRGHLLCELPRQQETVPLERLVDGKIERRSIAVKPHADPKLFEENRVENRLTVYRPLRKLPDPRCVEYRERWVERVVDGKDDAFTIEVGGDYEPLMRSITWEHAKGAPPKAVLLPRWRANDNVVPFSVDTLAATLAPDAKTDAERAFAVWRYCLATTNYYDAHYCETLPSGRHRPRISYTLLKHLNCYPFEQCGPLNYTARKLFLCAGISSNDASGTHHQFQQAFYAGGWRLHDLSSRQWWLARDNATVIGRDALEDDPWLKSRQGGNIAAWIRGRRSRHRFGAAVRPHSMDFPLRPGERVSVCWHNEGRWFELTGNRQPIPLAKIPPSFGNGAILFEPTGPTEAAELDNMTLDTGPHQSPTLRATDPAKAASLTYRVRCPYILSDARLTGACGGSDPKAIRVSMSVDGGKAWREVWHNEPRAGLMGIDLRAHVAARYAYAVRIAFAAGRVARIQLPRVRTTFVVSPLSLPGKLALGDNRIRFVGTPTVPVKTRCRWVERHRSALCLSLNSIRFYLDGGTTLRDLFVVAPGTPPRIRATLSGRRVSGRLALAGPWMGYSSIAPSKEVQVTDPGKPVTIEHVGKNTSLYVRAGDLLPVEVTLTEAGATRRVQARLLVVDAPLVREAERADQRTGEAKAIELAEASGARVVEHSGDGALSFDLTAPREGKYALWLRARWAKGSSTAMTLTLDQGKPRDLRAMAMIGFTDWTDPRRAHTKMFAHYGAQFTHWSWYRIPDVALTKGKHRLTLAAGAGAAFDALLLLPQNPEMDRAAMNLFQNWNYAPWQNPQ